MRGGPFHFTRNEMYLALCLLQLALGFFLNDWTTLLFVVPLALILHYGVVLREERYLTAKFGEPYLQYKSQVAPLDLSGKEKVRNSRIPCQSNSLNCSIGRLRHQLRRKDFHLANFTARFGFCIKIYVTANCIFDICKRIFNICALRMTSR